jgi:hypothetical protein
MYEIKAFVRLVEYRRDDLSDDGGENEINHVGVAPLAFEVVVPTGLVCGNTLSEVAERSSDNARLAEISDKEGAIVEDAGAAVGVVLLVRLVHAHADGRLRRENLEEAT